MLLQRVENTLRARGLLAPGANVVVACSGGADSVALADLLVRLQGRWRLRLCIAHFEHGIRGAASREDAAFVGRLAKGWGIPFRMGAGDAPGHAAAARISLETAARELRHAFLRETCDEMGCDAIALAHHADDQAETVLMRLLRGTGPDGLAAMGMQSGRILRPLLEIRKAELLAYCRERELPFREDGTNREPDALRNRIRLELLPGLRATYNPAVDAALCRLAELAAEEQDFLHRELDLAWPSLLRTGKGEPELSGAACAALHPALQRMAVRRYVGELFGDLQDLGYPHVAALLRLLLQGETGERAQLPHGHVLELSYGWLRKAREAGTPLEEQALAVPGLTKMPGWRFHAELLAEAPPPRRGAMEYICDWDRLPAPPTVRSRRPGDRISLPGGSKKLKELFIDLKIPRELRDCQPLLASDGTVLWAVGLRQGSLLRPDGQTRRVLHVRAERERSLL